MKTLRTETQPPLAAPGAGLPWMELQIARLGFGWMRRRATREKAAALLNAERDAVLDLVGDCDAEACMRRVLIPRPLGLEDSSRNWSVFMALDHLRIVNLGIADSIKRLGCGEVPARVASTAAVKPDPAVDEEVVASFVEACDAVATAARAVPNLHTSARYAHPWFGLLDAAAWHFMAGFHLRLHRGQIQTILHRLSPDAR